MNILTLLAGIWSAGLGGRLLYELLIYDYIIVLRNPVILFFDLAPLFAFGVLTVFHELKKGIIEIYGGNAPFISASPRLDDPQRNRE